MHKFPALIGDSRFRRPISTSALKKSRVAAGVLATAGGVAVLAAGAGTAEAKPAQQTKAVVKAKPAPPAPAPAKYTVKKGDSLYAIATRSGISVNALASANGLDAKKLIHPGQVLTLPATATTAKPSGTVLSPRDLPKNSPLLKLKPTFQSAAAQYGVDVGLLQAMTWNESGWQNSVVSKTGAIGIGQLMPDSTSFINQYLVKKPLNPRVPEDNIRMSAAYLKYLINQNKGDYKKALAAYYQGQASLNQRGQFDDTKQYVTTVLALKKSYF